MTRRHVDEFYTAYLEGSLPEEARRRVDAHLAECPRCAAGLEEMRGLVDALRDLPAPDAPENMAAMVRERLTRKAPRPLWPAWATAGALAAAIVVALAAPIWQRGTEMAKTPDAPVTTESTGDTRQELLKDATLDADAKTLTKPAPPQPATGTAPVTIAKDPFAGGRMTPPPPAPVIAPKPRGTRTAEPIPSPAMATDGMMMADSAEPKDDRAPMNDDEGAGFAATTRSAKSAAGQVGISAAGGAMKGADANMEAQTAAAPPTAGLPKVAPSPAAVMLNEARPADDALATPLPLRAALINGAKMQLRMTATEAGSLRVTEGKTERLYGVKPPETVVTLDATAGATYQLSLTTGATTTDFYLLTPSRPLAKPTGAPAGKALPALEALRGWTDVSGYALLAPNGLVKGEATLSAFTLDALQTYAAARDARATLDGGVATLAPKK